MPESIVSQAREAMGSKEDAGKRVEMSIHWGASALVFANGETTHLGIYSICVFVCVHVESAPAGVLADFVFFGCYSGVVVVVAPV